MHKVIDGFKTQGGHHCMTTALKQVFHYYGIEISEAMLFGLGEGLDFTYVNLAASPLVSGRSKIGVFEHTLAERMNVGIKIVKPSSYEKAFNTTKKMLDGGQPVYVYADMPYLPYLGMDRNSHFGGHAIVIFGYDDHQQLFYVSDRDNSDFPISSPTGELHSDYHLVAYADMEKARGSTHRPFPARSKYATFSLENFKGIPSNSLKESIHNTCNSMLNPGAGLKGINGIHKFSVEVKKTWSKFNDSRLAASAITNYFQINAAGGTGGGIFRKMYGDFLLEASAILACNSMEAIGNGFVALAKNWDNISNDLWKLKDSLDREQLNDISKSIGSLFETEKSLLIQLIELV